MPILGQPVDIGQFRLSRFSGFYGPSEISFPFHGINLSGLSGFSGLPLW